MIELVLIRGIPGSGKSTMARAMSGFYHLEADMFFELNGVYRYDASKIRDAHEWCQRETFKSLANGKSVVVSNTFTQRFEIEPYSKIAETFGIKLRILEAKGRWTNIHNIPANIIEKMEKRWESIDQINDSKERI